MALPTACSHRPSVAPALTIALLLALVALGPGAASAGEDEAVVTAELKCKDRKLFVDIPTVGQLLRGEKARMKVIKQVTNGEVVVSQTIAEQGIPPLFAVGLLSLSCEQLQSILTLFRPEAATADLAAGFPGLQAFRVGREPVDSAEGDFNRDGRPDLAVANNQSSDVSILLAAPDGLLVSAGPPPRRPTPGGSWPPTSTGTRGPTS